ncbi:cyclase family protein [Actinoplanes sp. NPDC026619]|uniref:cyclase family protein n=1 Tax=Actinoplanes sp. NPDC026619 TaxID=3155798 RepID=UPI0033CA4CE6
MSGAAVLLYRAELDADITLSNGGRLTARSLPVSVPHADVTHPEIAACVVAALGLRAVERVDLTSVRIFAEAAETTTTKSQPRIAYAELSHVIESGMTTYPGLPVPVITSHLTWEESRPNYAEGTEFSFDRIEMVGQTGTYLDSPRHRYSDGADLAGLPLGRLADLPAVVVRVAGDRRGIEAADLEPYVVAGHAVLLHTGADRHWGTSSYGVGSPFLTEAGARLLVERGAGLVGIDAANIDDSSPGSGGHRPAHSVLLAAEIPIVEHLTGLGELPTLGARFTAAAPRIAGFGTFPVRAFATMPYFEPHDHTRSAGWLPTAAD